MAAVKKKKNRRGTASRKKASVKSVPARKKSSAQIRKEVQVVMRELSALRDLASVKVTQTEERFQLMVEAVRDYAIFMLDPEGKVSTWNEGARRLKGYSSAEILGQNFSRFYTPEEQRNGRPQRALEISAKEGRYETEGWRVRKDGTRLWANVVIARIDDRNGKLIGFAKVTRDLTERRQAEEELRRSEERFRLMVSAVKDYAILMLDPAGHVISWNEGARRIKGYTSEEIIGSHFSRFYPPEEAGNGRPEEELRVAMSEGKFEEEAWRVRKNGTRFWANVVLTRLDDVNGRHVGFVKVTRDLTERREADERLRRANESLELRVRQRTAELEKALNTRDEFLSIASHELKTPLTSLKLQVEMMRRKIKVDQNKTPSAPEMARALDMASRQSNALSHLIDDLLDVSRVQTGKLRLSFDNFDLSEVVEEILGTLAHALQVAGCALDLQLERRLLGRWDRRRLEQILVNLVTNAIRYAPGKPIRISTFRGGGHVVLSVRDFGSGISKEDLLRIFERFTRINEERHVGGLGLGLYIVEKIVHAHCGAIRVESEKDQGAHFIVELPLDAEAARKDFEENSQGN